MSDTHDVSKMVGIYKKLFIFLVLVTALGIGVAFVHLPVWLAILIALGIIAIKTKFVTDAFKHLLVGKNGLVILFALTAIFFLGLIILPLFNHNGQIVGTVDLSKEIQMQDAPTGHDAHTEGAQHGH